jgi:hypothetical protein
MTMGGPGLAIVGMTVVPNGSQAEFDRLNEGVEAAMMQMGGPPAGLMAHLVYPSGEGFVICGVWRTEADMRPFHDEVVLAKLADVGLEPAETVVSPVWSFARP